MMRGKLDYLGDVLDVFAQIANGQGQGELERGEVDQFGEKGDFGPASKFDFKDS